MQMKAIKIEDKEKFVAKNLFLCITLFSKWAVYAQNQVF